jgi:hypothetical protein
MVVAVVPTCHAASFRTSDTSPSTCTDRAVLAMRASAPRNGLRTTIYWNVADAPKSASLYCHAHARDILDNLVDSYGIARTVEVEC